MSLRITLLTAGRVLRQLRHDRRTIAMIVVVPPALLALLYFMFEDRPQVFDRVALSMLGIFPFVLMFLLTSIAMLRERTTGTLERLFTTPCAKTDVLFGYGLAFGLAAAVQATVATLFSTWVLGLDPAGHLPLVVLVAVTNGLLGVSLGLFFSAFAHSEFQAVQFMPVVALPQILLCGLFVPRDAMAGWLQTVSDLLPLTYAVNALQEIGAHAEATGTMWWNLAVVGAVAVLALVLGAATLRRRTP